MPEPDRRSTAFVGSSIPESYDRHLAPVIFEPWAERLVQTAGVHQGDRVLDVASGTGVVARLAAGHAGPDGRVVASDVSPAMLAFSAGRPAGMGAAPIEFVEASATDLPGADGGFDVVLCQQGLPFFPDRPAALAEIRRVLRPGGTAAVSVWAAGHRLEPFEDYNQALLAVGAEPPFSGAFEGSSFVMGVEEVEDAFRAAGFGSSRSRWSSTR